MAEASNEFLESLYKGTIPESKPVPSIYEVKKADIPGGFSNEDEELIVQEFNEWIVNQGLPAGEILYELIEESTGEPLAILDIAWPKGLQEGLSQPVALLIDEEKETELMMEWGGMYLEAGYPCFHTSAHTGLHVGRFGDLLKDKVMGLSERALST